MFPRNITNKQTNRNETDFSQLTDLLHFLKVKWSCPQLDGVHSFTAIAGVYGFHHIEAWKKLPVFYKQNFFKWKM